MVTRSFELAVILVSHYQLQLDGTISCHQLTKLVCLRAETLSLISRDEYNQKSEDSPTILVELA